MAIDIQPIDYGALAKSRIAQQYKNLPKFTALVDGLAKLIESGLETPCAKLFEILDIDKMEGANLDNIGEIVGQSRDVLTYEALIFFGMIYEMEWDETVTYPLDDTIIDPATNTTYKSLQADNLNHAITDAAWWEAVADPDPTTGSFGDDLDPGVGARFLGDVDSAFANDKRPMEDPEYRLFIKARILKNYSKGTLGDLVAAVQTLTGAEQVKIDEGVMELDIGVLGTIDQNTLDIIQNYDILPRPTGVQINEPYAYSILNFNGTTSKVDFATTTDFDIGTDDFEIRFRIKTPEQDAIVLSKEDDVNSTTPSYCLYIEGGVLKFSYSPVDGTEVVVAGAFVADGAVKNCIVKNVSGVVSVSVDGEAVLDSENVFEAATGAADFLKVGVSELRIKEYPLTIMVSGSGLATIDGAYTLNAPYNGKYNWIYWYGSTSRTIGWDVISGQWVVRLYLNGNKLYYNLGVGDIPDKTEWLSIQPSYDPAPTLEYSILLPLSGILQDLSITIGGTPRGHWSMIKTHADVGTDPTTLVDLSGNGNDGTITDPVWQNSLTI